MTNLFNTDGRHFVIRYGREWGIPRGSDLVHAEFLTILADETGENR